MQSANERRHSELESRVPLVDALDGITEALDQLQKRVLPVSFSHHYSPSSGRVHVRPSGSAAGGSAGRFELIKGAGRMFAYQGPYPEYDAADLRTSGDTRRGEPR